MVSQVRLVLLTALQIVCLLFAGNPAQSETSEPVPQEKLWGFVDHSGNFVIKPRFETAGSFHEGLAPVMLGRKYGYINKQGDIIISPQFEYGQEFSEGIALIKGAHSQFGYINRKGEAITATEFENAGPFREGLAIAKAVNGPISFIDGTGKKTCETSAGWGDWGGGFAEGLVAVMLGKKNGPSYLWGFLDRHGKVAIPGQWAVSSSDGGVSEFFEGLAAFSTLDSKGRETDGIIDQNGTVLLQSTEHGYSAFSEGLAVVFDLPRSNNRGYIGKDFKIKIKQQFQDAQGFKEGFALVANTDWQFGYIRCDGTVAVPFAFRSGKDFSEGLAAVMTNDNVWGFIDNKGKFAIDPKFYDVNSFSEGLAAVCTKSDR